MCTVPKICVGGGGQITMICILVKRLMIADYRVKICLLHVLVVWHGMIRGRGEFCFQKV